MIGVDERGVHGFHARGTRERAQEPVVDASGVVGVHAGQVAHLFPDDELHHADDALALFGAVVLPGGQVVYEAEALGDAHLLLLVAEEAAATADVESDADSPTHAHLRGLEVGLLLSAGGHRVVSARHLLEDDGNFSRGSGGVLGEEEAVLCDLHTMLRDQRMLVYQKCMG